MKKQAKLTDRMLRGRLSRWAFTLIELLIVIAVILILSGISLKLLSLVGRKAATAKTINVLEQTRNALEAYYVANGTYPPVNVIAYVRAASTNQFSYNPQLPTTYGLAYYLLYMPDPRMDSWTKFSSRVIVQDKPKPVMAHSPTYGSTLYSNVTSSIEDGWGNTIRYQPNADFSAYQLWSDGLNGSIIGISRNE